MAAQRATVVFISADALEFNRPGDDCGHCQYKQTVRLFGEDRGVSYCKLFGRRPSAAKRAPQCVAGERFLLEVAGERVAELAVPDAPVDCIVH